MAIRLTAQHLAQGGADGRYEPQRANNGILIIAGLPGWEESGEITLSLESFPLPKENNASIEARYMNERRKFPGPANVEDMEVSIKDTVDRTVAHQLLAWRRLVYNPGRLGDYQQTFGPTTPGAIGLARTIKKSGLIKLVAPDGTYERAWEVDGLWPLSMDPGDIDMTSEDFIRITMTLSVDRIIAARLKPVPNPR